MGATLKLGLCTAALASASLVHAQEQSSIEAENKIKAEELVDIPVWTGTYEPQGDDEIGLWTQVDELEEELKFSQEIIRDPELQSYVEGVLCAAVGDDRCSAARIYLLRRSTFNAGIYPNGMMVVNSGLMLRMRNEAEFAAVLAHEFAHFEMRHSLQLFQEARSKSDTAAIASIFIGVLALFIVDDIFSFSRDMEREADLTSAEFLVGSVYASNAVVEIWNRLLEEDDLRAEERDRKKRGRKTRLFDTHPPAAERAKYLAAATEGKIGEGDLGTERYNEAMAPYLLTFFDDQLQRNDFAASEFLVDALAGDDWKADHYLMKGELYRSRGQGDDLETARDAFAEAIAAGSERPETWRGLGLAQIRLGERAEGRASLATYLEMAPEADDASLIAMMAGVKL